MTWISVEEKSPVRKVVCAACKHGNVIFAGARHYDSVMHTQIKALGGKWGTEIPKCGEQGFIDQFGVFMDREEAMIVAKSAGQDINYERQGGYHETLFSEGLY